MAEKTNMSVVQMDSETHRRLAVVCKQIGRKQKDVVAEAIRKHLPILERMYQRKAAKS